MCPASAICLPSSKASCSMRFVYFASAAEPMTPICNFLFFITEPILMCTVSSLSDAINDWSICVRKLGSDGCHTTRPVCYTGSANMLIVDRMQRGKLALFLCGFVFCIAVITYLWNLNTLPFVDYDEATYAQVSDHTVDSGDLLTLRRYGEPWFEKPPLYFWMTGVTTRIFGRHEYAYRLPSVVMALLALVLLWLIVRRLSGDALRASLATLVLLSWPFYYLAARQVRLDIPVIAMLLATLAALVYGFRKQQWLIAGMPAVALGFMLKSFIALLALPILVIFSFVYGEWRWLRSRYLWYGFALALLIAVPWHGYEVQQGGSEFVSSYFGYHIFERAAGGIGQSAGFQLFAYVRQPWAS